MSSRRSCVFGEDPAVEEEIDPRIIVTGASTDVVWPALTGVRQQEVVVPVLPHFCRWSLR